MIFPHLRCFSFFLLVPLYHLQECGKDNAVYPALQSQSSFLLIFFLPCFILLRPISLTLFLHHWFPFFSLISSFFTPSLVPSPSISPPGDPMEMFNCSEMSTVSWTKWLSSHVSWHKSLIHFSFSLFAVISRAFFLLKRAGRIHKLSFIFSFFDSSRLYIIEPVKMSD